MGIHGAKPFELDVEAKKVFSLPHHKIVVTVGGERTHLDRETQRIPIHELGNYLLGDWD
jgi:hypothetical protein